MRQVALMLAVTLLTANTSPASAQEEDAFICRAWITPMGDSASLKGLIGRVSDAYQVSYTRLEDSDHALYFVTVDRVLLSELCAHARGSSYTVEGFSCLNNHTGNTVIEGTPPRPLHEDTGDEDADHARYEAAKALWIQRYPEAYERLLRGQSLSGDGE